jgi:hypothetical protein
MPAGGAVVSLASSNRALAFPLVPSVTIPAGASSATFPIATAGMVSSTAVTISASWSSSVQSAVLTVIAPYRLSSVTLDTPSQFGGFTVQGTVTLSGPADSTAVVALTSSNAAIAPLPATVTIPAGATSATFPISLQPVASSTPVAVTASLGGVSQNATLTVLAAQDSVQISRAQYTVRNAELRVETTSTSNTATLTVWNAGTGALIGTLSNAGGGKYNATFSGVPAVGSITVKSSLGGIRTGAVAQK